MVWIKGASIWKLFLRLVEWDRKEAKKRQIEECKNLKQYTSQPGPLEA